MTRFPDTVATAEEALRYYRNRALQLLTHGWSWDGNHIDHGWGVEVCLSDGSGGKVYSVFVLEGHTGQGHLSRWFDANPDKVFVTSRLCQAMKSWLLRKAVSHLDITPLLTSHTKGAPFSRAYMAVSSFYGDHQAERSGLHLMNHIDEGLDILTSREASEATKDAWCLHPLLQSDEHLQDTLAAGGHLSGQDPTAIVLAMEYRQRANAHLAKHAPKLRPTWGPLDEVRQMLIADKMQNRKDFDLHLRGSVPNSDRLDAYFKEWFGSLGITEENYQAWVASVGCRTGGTG
jgi:hypothetical protein